jgi:hypothetical protein
MQPAVETLIQLGPLPDSQHATEEALNYLQQLLTSVWTPITDEEAVALSQLFGPDDCFGIAWSLVHLIETSPGWPSPDVINRAGGHWIELLRERAA